MTSDLYMVAGSVGTESRNLTPHTIAVDTCSGYNLIARRALPAGWKQLYDAASETPRLAGADESPLQLSGTVALTVRLGNNYYRVQFVIAEKLAVDVLLGTAFIDEHVRAIDVQSRNIPLMRGGAIPILNSRKKDDHANKTEQPRKQMSRRQKRGMKDWEPDTHVIRLTRTITVPPMSQYFAHVASDAVGLVHIEPKPTLQFRHGLRVANGVHELQPNAEFRVHVSNFTDTPRTIPKGTVVAYAKRNPLAIITPERRLGEEFGRVMNITTLPNPPPEDATPRNLDEQNEPLPTTATSEAHDDPATLEKPWEDAIDLSHVEDAELRGQIIAMLRKHAKMWDGTLGTIHATEHRIDLEPGTRPMRSMPYRQGPARREMVREQVDAMLRAGVIEPATSEWASPVVLVPKKDNSLRFCVDYRSLNGKTIADTYPLPRMDDCIDSLGDAAIFTTLDCNSGYWQIPIAEEDRDKTTFTSFLGTFRYLRMPFGLKNAPATFQRALDIILSGVRWQICLVYLDDVIVFSRGMKEHIAHLDQVLTLLRAAGVSLKLKKCQFFQSRVDYLGHVISPGKLSMATESSAAFAECKFPRTLTQVRSFLGACNVYRRFVKDFSKIAKPLTDMTRKDAKPDYANPTEAQLTAFETLKARLVSPPILSLPRHGRPYLLDTDASAYQLGCALLQEQEDGEWSPVGYWSYSLNDAERNYSATERECYAVVWAITSLRPYIEGTRFTVRTDHDALRWLMTLTESSGRLTRWRLRLAEFDFVVQYRPGRVHQVPDALSRLERPRDSAQTAVDDDVPAFEDATNPLLAITRARSRSAAPNSPSPTNATNPPNSTPAGENTAELLDDDLLDDVEDVDPFDISRINPTDEPTNLTDIAPADLPAPLTTAEILDAQRNDDFCQTVLSRQDPRKDAAFFEDPEDGLLKRRHPADKTLIQIVVPSALRPRLCTLAHHAVLAGHPGQNRMFYTLRETYYWPHMAADVAATVRNCRHCARNRLRLRRHMNRLKLFPATRPLESVAIDILGPLPRTKSGKRFLLVITDRYTKLTQVAALRSITAYHVAVAFCETWVFKYGPPATLLSDNGKQFTSRFFQSVCQLLGLSNVFVSAYHPQANGQTERYNRTILAMLRNYINDNQDDWDRYASAVTYAYNNHVHRSTRTTPFNLVLSRPPPAFTLAHPTSRPKPSQDVRADFLKRLDESFTRASKSLQAVQARYKRDFDKRVKTTKKRIRVGDFVYLDATDGVTKPGKLTSPATGPFRVLFNDSRTILIDRDGLVERVSADRVIFSPPPADAPPNPYAPTPAELAEKAREGPAYVVDKIVGHGEDEDGHFLFRVKWQGYRDTTWEPRKNLPEELVSLYFAKLHQRADPRQRRR